MNNLQETRKEKIPGLIDKYQKLVDDIFDTVSKPMPDFKNVESEEGEITISSEQQMYAFIGVRKSALDTANRMLIQINELERELHDPTWSDKPEQEQEVPATTNIAKRHSKK